MDDNHISNFISMPINIPILLITSKIPINHTTLFFCSIHIETLPIEIMNTHELPSRTLTYIYKNYKASSNIITIYFFSVTFW